MHAESDAKVLGHRTVTNLLNCKNTVQGEHREARLAEMQTCTNCLLFSSLHADVRDSCDDLRYSVSYPSLHDKRSSSMSCKKRHVTLFQTEFHISVAYKNDSQD